MIMITKGSVMKISSSTEIKRRELWIAWELENGRRNIQAPYLEISILIQLIVVLLLNFN